MARSLASKKQYHFIAITPSFAQGEYWEAISEGIDKACLLYTSNNSYMRLKNLTLSYNLPKQWISKLSLSSVQVLSLIHI